MAKQQARIGFAFELLKEMPFYTDGDAFAEFPEPTTAPTTALARPIDAASNTYDSTGPTETDGTAVSHTTEEHPAWTAGSSIIAEAVRQALVNKGIDENEQTLLASLIYDKGPPPPQSSQEFINAQLAQYTGVLKVGRERQRRYVYINGERWCIHRHRLYEKLGAEPHTPWIVTDTNPTPPPNQKAQMFALLYLRMDA